MNDDTPVRYAAESGAGTITLDRPKVNAYDMAFHRALAEAIARAEADPAVRVVVLRSARPGFFCVGADVKVWAAHAAAGRDDANAAMVELARANTARMAGSTKIYLAHLAGHALGGGLELALACDLIVAEDGDYGLGLPEVKLGLMPGNGGAVRLARRLGYSRALRLAATGETLGPGRALELGLIDHLGPPDALIDQLAAGPGAALAEIKAALRAAADGPLDAALAAEAAGADRLPGTADAAEGLAAFAEKRAPRFGAGPAGGGASS